MIRKIFNYLFTDFHLLTDKMAMDAYKALFVLVIAQMLVWFSFFGLLNTGEELILMVIGFITSHWVTQLEGMDVFFGRPLKYYRLSFLLKYKPKANPNAFISIRIYSRVLDIRMVCNEYGHIEEKYLKRYTGNFIHRVKDDLKALRLMDNGTLHIEDLKILGRW